MEDIIIPIDQQLQEFRSHIIANPRTFLSSKFGDGKTYFIDKVKEAFKDEFVFLTIYPVKLSSSRKSRHLQLYQTRHSVSDDV